MNRLLLFFFSLFLTSGVSAHNSAQATAQATVVNRNTPMVIQQFNSLDKTIEIIGKVGDNTCQMKYSVIIKNNNTVKTIPDFGTCSTIIRAKIVKDQLVISMPDNIGGYVSYIHPLTD